MARFKAQKLLPADDADARGFLIGHCTTETLRRGGKMQKEECKNGALVPRPTSIQHRATSIE